MPTYFPTNFPQKLNSWNICFYSQKQRITIIEKKEFFPSFRDRSNPMLMHIIFTYLFIFLLTFISCRLTYLGIIFIYELNNFIISQIKFLHLATAPVPYGMHITIYRKSCGCTPAFLQWRDFTQLACGHLRHEKISTFRNFVSSWQLKDIWVFHFLNTWSTDELCVLP